MKTQKYDISGLICLWALAESGIGGVLHALRLPFTGIFVGGFAVISIALIAWYSSDKNEILKALSIVLAVKLLASPHSPWQAYVAVAFQGLLGYFLFNHRQQYALRTIAFTTICLLESALQKILLAILIFGTEFLSAVDKSAINVAQSVGIELDSSVVTWLFVVYTLLHLLTGIFLGLWIPSLPQAIARAEDIANNDIEQHKPVETQNASSWKGLLFVLTGIALLLYFYLPDNAAFNLVSLLLRVILLTLTLTFAIGPLIKMLILKYLAKNKQNKAAINQVLIRLPHFRNKLIQHYYFARNNFRGIKAIKFFILGMLVFSLKGEDAATP
ncbi:MAG TPA: hypothetical protein PLQ57_08155 [Saprospiraceae bacterium]|nr:hypothetical protein [Saprospiraceae bacterium]HRG65540.1 hypothetical protein [Saprospiraceae bacterium]